MPVNRSVPPSDPPIPYTPRPPDAPSIGATRAPESRTLAGDSASYPTGAASVCTVVGLGDPVGDGRFDEGTAETDGDAVGASLVALTGGGAAGSGAGGPRAPCGGASGPLSAIAASAPSTSVASPATRTARGIRESPGGDDSRWRPGESSRSVTTRAGYCTDRWTWFRWSPAGVPSPWYERQPLDGSQIWRYQITYRTASRSALASSQAASRSPYALSSPVAGASRKPDGWAERSQARPSGCSPQVALRQQAAYRVKPARRTSCRAWRVRGVRHPLVVGSFTEHDSCGQVPSRLRGAGVAEAVPPENPPDGWLPALASDCSMSVRRLSIAATAACWVRTSVCVAAVCSAYRRCVSRR